MMHSSIGNELTGEHLIDIPDQYITTCIHNSDTLSLDTTSATNIEYGKYFYEPIPPEQEMQYLVSGNVPAYVSNIDAKNKYSRNFGSCTSLIVVGKEKEQQKNISLMTHQHIMHDFNRNYNNRRSRNHLFHEKLTNQLQQLKEQTIPGTIDAIILGGHVGTTFCGYNSTINQVNKAVSEIFQLNACVVGGPTIYHGEDSITKDIYLDTQNRRVHLFKPHNIIESNISFGANQINEVDFPVYPIVNTWGNKIKKLIGLKK